MGFGAVAGEIAYPHSGFWPAVLVAAAVLVFGLQGMFEERRLYDQLALEWFMYGPVCPPAFLLGELVQQRMRKKQRKASHGGRESL
jgi:hypothetical protein